MPKTINRQLEFNPNQWAGYEKASCYLYAINVFINSYYLVGDMIGKTCNNKVSDLELIKILKKEINFLGYKIEEIKKEEEVDNEKFLKICLIRDERTGFYHFLRQEKDKSWSEKYPMELPNKVDFKDEDSVYNLDFRKRWYFKIRVSNC